MDYRKLFQVLVVGGAVVGGATSCTGKTAEAAEQPKRNPQDAGTPSTPPDAGDGIPSGVKGW